MRLTNITSFAFSEQEIQDALVAAINKEFSNMDIHNPKFEWTDTTVTVTCTTSQGNNDIPSIDAPSLPSVNIPEVPTPSPAKAAKTPKPSPTTTAPTEVENTTNPFASIFGEALSEEGIVTPVKEFTPVASAFPSFSISK